MTEPFRFYIGVDLGTQQHRLRLLDQEGNPVAALTMDHSGHGLTDLLKWLAQTQAIPVSTAVALEAPRGPIVDLLLEHGYAVYSINPKQLDRFRDRFSVAGAKDDDRDALALASSLRTDRHCFRRLQPDPPAQLRLRELVRAQASYQQDLRRATNQLWSLLQRYFPGSLALCPAADEVWLWKLLHRVQALPERAAKLRLRSLETLLRQHRIRRFSAQQLAQHLSQPLFLAPGVATALAEPVLRLLPRLTLLHLQSADIEHRIQDQLEKMSLPSSGSDYRTLQILSSVPGLGRMGTATLICEAAPLLRERDLQRLRTWCGVAPVTLQSGKTRGVSFRRACNPRLRNILFHCANVHMQQDPRAEQLYSQHRHRGQSHARALRSVGDRLLQLICTLLRTGKDYDPQRRTCPSGAASH